MAFALPILQRLFQQTQLLHSLIITPTRELALQTSRVVEALGAISFVRSVVLVGGAHRMSEAIALAKELHILVATPGRLLDHLQDTKGFPPIRLKYLVIDEADRLLGVPDFKRELDQIMRLSPRKRTYLFSATMSSKVDDVRRASLSSPVRVSVSSKIQTVATLLQSYLFIPHRHKDLYLAHLLDELAGRTCIIFTRTRREAQRLSFILQSLRLLAVTLHAGLRQEDRRKR